MADIVDISKLTLDDTTISQAKTVEAIAEIILNHKSDLSLNDKYSLIDAILSLEASPVKSIGLVTTGIKSLEDETDAKAVIINFIDQIFDLFDQRIVSKYIESLYTIYHSILSAGNGTFATLCDKILKASIHNLKAKAPEATATADTKTVYNKIVSDSLMVLILGLSVLKKDIFNDSMLKIIISIVLPYVDLRNESDLKSKAAIVLAKCLELNAEVTMSQLTYEIESLLEQDELTALIVVFSTVSTLFHINSDLAAVLFCLPSFQATTQQQNLKSQYLLSSHFVAAALECLSSACINKECRTTVLTNYSNLVEEAVNNGQGRVRLLAATVLIKIKSTSNPIIDPAATAKEGDNARAAASAPARSIDELSLILEQAFSDESSDAECISVASEGLAYSTLEISVRQRLITNTRVLKRLTDIITTQLKNSSLVYGALSIISNLTRYPPQLTKEQTKMRDLKAYADKQGKKEAVEETKLIDDRNKVILNSKIVKIISDNCPRYSPSSKAVCATILNSLSNVKLHRGVIAQDGGVATLIYFLLPIEEKTKTTSLDPQATCICGSALAKILISINPALVFTTKLSPIVAVRPLINQIQNEASEVPLLDTFEALLALTNIASFNDVCRDTMIRISWDKLENLFTSNNDMIQRAAIELLCNLMMSPFCAEKYLDGSQHAISRLELLAALTDIDDLATQRASVGALAMLSEWGPAGEIMGLNTKLVDRLFQILSDDDNDDILHRAIVTLNNLTHTSTSGKAKVVDFLRNHGAVQAIQDLVKSTKNESIIEVALDTARALATKN